ncbi:MAG TPA: tetratricopeptide repeat protein [Polyangiaceae bacterium]|nr:tetratricopeptide repeat protein [Polyangiaceae bacterium]
MEDFDDELREIKREIIESRGLIIKTNNLTNALSADLKSIAKRQLGYETRLRWNSATAYVVFVIVVFIALKLAWDARIDAVTAQTEQTRAQVAQLKKELQEAQQRDEERARIEARAASLYELMRQNKNVELIEALDAVDKNLLSKTELRVFSDAAEKARNELSIAAYQNGLEHVRGGRWHEAQQAFEESLRYKDSASHASAARYFLADSLRKLGRQRDAIPMLMQLSEASADKEYLDDATWLLAQCLVDIQAWNDAKNALRNFIRRFPQSPFVNESKTLLADLNLKH